MCLNSWTRDSVPPLRKNKVRVSYSSLILVPPLTSEFRIYTVGSIYLKSFMCMQYVNRLYAIVYDEELSRKFFNFVRGLVRGLSIVGARNEKRRVACFTDGILL